MKQILRYGLILLCFSGLAGVSLHGVNVLTRERIAAAQQRALTEGQRQIFPAAARFGEQKTFPVGNKTAQYFEAFDTNGVCIGYELLHTVQGYQSPITVLTAIDRRGIIAGIKILSQAETPGLGAEVEAVPASRTLWQALAGLVRRVPAQVRPAAPPLPPFQAQFAGKSLTQLRVVKQPTRDAIEAIAGATITSEAVTKAVRDAISNFFLHVAHPPTSEQSP
ncbi:MAG: FMN-binding protein [bacterium]|nr:FMN-binding protein [bacterium]